MVVSQIVTPPFVANMAQLTTYDDITAALRASEMESFRDEYSHDFLGGTLPALNGQEHFARRRLESPIFNTSALRSWQEETLRPLVDSYLTQLASTTSLGEHPQIDLLEAGLHLLVRIGASFSGLGEITSQEQASRLLNYVESFSTGVGFEWVRLPDDERASLLTDTVRNTQKFRDEFFEPALLHRRSLIQQYENGEIQKEELPRDVLTMMLIHENKSSEDVMFREVALYLHASILTTAGAVCHSVEEITAWLDVHPEDRWILEDPDALRDAVSEVLRLHPLVPALVRRATADITMPSGMDIAAGTDVALLFRFANLEPGVYGDDAKTFNPFRTQVLPPTVSPSGFTFGGGTHMCMGRRMAGGDGKSAENGTSSDGMVSTIVQAFFRVGVAPDPVRPAQITQTTFHDHYTTYPVILTSLNTER